MIQASHQDVEGYVEILKSLSPQELINQFSAVLPSLNISVEDFDKQSIQTRSKRTSKNLF